MKRGYIKLWRRIQDDELWQQRRRFSKIEAWIDLLLMANHKKSKIFVGNREIVVKRGEVFTSQLQLSKRWNWSIGSVNSFLNKLQIIKKAETKAENKYTIIFILNYSLYQRNPRKLKANLKTE